jgi:hypothetical protein
VGEVVHHDLEAPSRRPEKDRVHAESTMKRDLKFWGILAALGAFFLIWIVIEIHSHA